MNHRRRAILVAASLASLAAAPPARALMAGALPDSALARIDPNTPASSWTSAVSVIVNGGTYSGVVVAPRYVLTAAHVPGAALPTAVSVQVNALSTPVVIAATAIAIFPGASFPYDDLALITLATPVPDTVEVLPIYRQTLTARQTVTLVGYGASGNGDVGPSVPSAAGVKRSGLNSIDAVQTTIDTSGRTSLFYLMDFDGPTGNGAFGVGTLGNALETGLASGDSGSPAFATIGGQRWLMGINNFTSPAPGNSAIDFKFGTLAGGMLLSDPRFIAWLTTQTQNTLGQSSASAGDAPLPGWALAVLGVALAGKTVARRRGAQP